MGQWSGIDNHSKMENDREMFCQESARGCLRRYCHTKGKSPPMSGKVAQEVGTATRRVLKEDGVPHALQTERRAGGCRLGGYRRKDDRLLPESVSGLDGGRQG